MATVARKPGWWYPYIFLAAFVVVLMVNLTFAFFATKTFSGLATESPYEKGLAYNQNLNMAKQQESMGWTVDTKVEAVDGGAHRSAVVVGYRDRDGQPVIGLEVQAQLVRPTAKGYDRKVPLAPVGPGLYRVTLDLPLEGVWDLDVVALGKDASYQFAKRIVVQ